MARMHIHTHTQTQPPSITEDGGRAQLQLLTSAVKSAEGQGERKKREFRIEDSDVADQAESPPAPSTPAPVSSAKLSSFPTVPAQTQTLAAVPFPNGGIAASSGAGHPPTAGTSVTTASAGTAVTATSAAAPTVQPQAATASAPPSAPPPVMALQTGPFKAGAAAPLLSSAAGVAVAGAAGGAALMSKPVSTVSIVCTPALATAGSGTNS